MTTIWERLDAEGGKTTTYTISPGDSFGGRFSSSGDTDWIKLKLTAGVSYVFGASGDDSRYPEAYYPRIEVRNADGSSTGYSGTSVIFTPTATGNYFLNIYDYYGYTGGYLVTTAADLSGDKKTTLIFDQMDTSNYRHF